MSFWVAKVSDDDAIKSIESSHNCLKLFSVLHPKMSDVTSTRVSAFRMVIDYDQRHLP